MIHSKNTSFTGADGAEATSSASSGLSPAIEELPDP